jgi:hypothetical protein
MHIRLVILSICFLYSFNKTFAQGCSDAGFCTMGAMKPDQPYNKKIELRLRSMELSFYRGTTNLTPVIYVATADLNFSLSRKTFFQLKLPYQAVTGRLANTNGLGDISLCLTRNIYSTEKFDVNVSVGGKIPTNRSDKDINGYPLPMYYQTSLGTYDFITGLSLLSKNWLVATGVQHPFNQNNNQFLWGRWNGSAEDMAYIERYAPANLLKRGTDVMLRVERNIRFSRLNFSLGFLPIYRINRDRIINGAGVEVRREEAKGLAMSGIFTVGYNFNVQSGIRLLAGHKIVQRQHNPDGLTRDMVSTITYVYRF